MCDVQSCSCNGISLTKIFIQVEICGLVWLHDPDTLELSFCHHGGNCAVTDLIHRDFNFHKNLSRIFFKIYFSSALSPDCFPRYHNLINHWTKIPKTPFQKHYIHYFCTFRQINTCRSTSALKIWPFLLD